MERPAYSFDITQSGDNVVIDACVPVAVGVKIALVILEHAESVPMLPTRRRAKRPPKTTPE
jgi:hypothetical protein